MLQAGTLNSAGIGK